MTARLSSGLAAPVLGDVTEHTMLDFVPLAFGLRIARLSQLPPPAADAFHGELRRIVIDSHADPALIGRQIADAVPRSPQSFKLLLLAALVGKSFGV